MIESRQALVQHNRAMAVGKSPGPGTLIRWGKLGAVFGKVRRSSCSCGRPYRTIDRTFELAFSLSTT